MLRIFESWTESKIDDNLFRKQYLWFRFILSRNNVHVFIIDEDQAFNSWQKILSKSIFLKFNPFSIFANRKNEISMIFV